jgi:hypothetical protein
MYATPRTVNDLDACQFYHSMNIPGYGEVQGEWDLRGGVDKYVGGIDFRGKRVLEVGTASGFLCFEMERRGAEVVTYDLSEEHMLDLAPSRCDYDQRIPDYKAFIRRLNNSYWLCHRAFGSKAKMVYGSVYNIPDEIGPVHITTLSSILCHLRNPYAAIQAAVKLATETVIITEVLWTKRFIFQALTGISGPSMVFLPNPSSREPQANWWMLSPSLVQKFIASLGFEQSTVRYHLQRHQGRRNLLYTVVGQRTRPVEETWRLPTDQAGSLASASPPPLVRR